MKDELGEGRTRESRRAFNTPCTDHQLHTQQRAAQLCARKDAGPCARSDSLLGRLVMNNNKRKECETDANGEQDNKPAKKYKNTEDDEDVNNV